jgi:hypothetical protein
VLPHFPVPRGEDAEIDLGHYTERGKAGKAKRVHG